MTPDIEREWNREVRWLILLFLALWVPVVLIGVGLWVGWFTWPTALLGALLYAVLVRGGAALIYLHRPAPKRPRVDPYPEAFTND